MERENSSFIRQKVLEMLADADVDFPRSAPALSQQLQIPAAEIQKTIAQLRRDGYGIVGKPFSGYYLERFPDALEEGLIRYEYLKPWHTFLQKQCPIPLPDFSCFASEDAADAYLTENCSVLPNGAFAVADGALAGKALADRALASLAPAGDDTQTNCARSAQFILLHHRLVHLAFLLKGGSSGEAEELLSRLTEQIFRKITEISEDSWADTSLTWTISGNQLFCCGTPIAAITLNRLAPDAVLVKIDAGLNHIDEKFDFSRSRLAARLIQCCLDEIMAEKE